MDQKSRMFGVLLGFCLVTVMLLLMSLGYRYQTLIFVPVSGNILSIRDVCTFERGRNLYLHQYCDDHAAVERLTRSGYALLGVGQKDFTVTLAAEPEVRTRLRVGLEIPGASSWKVGDHLDLDMNPFSPTSVRLRGEPHSQLIYHTILFACFAAIIAVAAYFGAFRHMARWFFPRPENRDRSSD